MQGAAARGSGSASSLAAAAWAWLWLQQAQACDAVHLLRPRFRYNLLVVFRGFGCWRGRPRDRKVDVVLT